MPPRIDRRRRLLSDGDVVEQLTGAGSLPVSSRFQVLSQASDIILLHVGYSSNDYAAPDQMITILDGLGLDLVTIEELFH